MRMMLTAVTPNEPFNTLVREGKAGEVLGKIMEAIKPEAVYFTAKDGKRAGHYIVNLESPSDIPGYAEPFFLLLNAEVEFSVVMTPEDLAKAGLDEMGALWGSS